MGHLAHNDPISVPTCGIPAQIEALAEALLDLQGQDDWPHGSLRSPEFRTARTDFRRQSF
jgi:hypothetical protein